MEAQLQSALLDTAIYQTKYTGYIRPKHISLILFVKKIIKSSLHTLNAWVKQFLIGSPFLFNPEIPVDNSAKHESARDGGCETFLICDWLLAAVYALSLVENKITRFFVELHENLVGVGLQTNLTV